MNFSPDYTLQTVGTLFSERLATVHSALERFHFWKMPLTANRETPLTFRVLIPIWLVPKSEILLDGSKHGISSTIVCHRPKFETMPDVYCSKNSSCVFARHGTMLVMKGLCPMAGDLQWLMRSDRGARPSRSRQSAAMGADHVKRVLR
jgi:hypothetical protein